MVTEIFFFYALRPSRVHFSILCTHLKSFYLNLRMTAWRPKNVILLHRCSLFLNYQLMLSKLLIRLLVSRRCFEWTSMNFFLFLPLMHAYRVRALNHNYQVRSLKIPFLYRVLVMQHVIEKSMHRHLNNLRKHGLINP